MEKMIVLIKKVIAVSYTHLDVYKRQVGKLGSVYFHVTDIGFLLLYIVLVSVS